jgi:hypothetical protein
VRQSYFTAGGLPPISSSWRQDPWDSRPVIFSAEHLRSYSLCNILSDEMMGLSFTIAADPRQRGHSQVRIPRDSWPHFHHHQHWHDSPMWAPAFLRIARQSSLFNATFIQFLRPKFWCPATHILPISVLVFPLFYFLLDYFADSGGRSVGIVRLRTKATEFSLVGIKYFLNHSTSTSTY